MLLRKKVIDFCVLLFLGFSCLTFSILLYARQIWPDADYEQILITLESLSFDIVKTNTVMSDYFWALLFFIIIFPLCYIFLGTLKRFCVALILFLAVLYSSGYLVYCFYQFSTSHLYEEEYKSPREIIYTFPEKKRNLILIYLESFEQNFAQAQYYEKNLIPNLDNLHNEGAYSSAHYQLPGTGFSIASLVASQCGIPLRHLSTRDIYATKYFLPQAVCFPEILKENGYQTAIVKASDIHFTNVDTFAYSHGYDEALGKEQILKHYPVSQHQSLLGGFDGVSDETLFSFAKKKLAMFTPDKPFMLTLFTLDTHTPVEHFSTKCPRYFNDIRDAFICTDNTVANFIDWLKTSPYWKNTTVVIMGDHLLPVQLKPHRDLHRGIYNVFLNLPDDAKINPSKIFSTFDMAPSILESLGITLSERSFGLGHSLFSDTPTLLEKLGFTKLKMQLLANSKIYNKFNMLPMKRIDKYTNYQLGEIINNNNIAKFTDASENFLGIYYIDRLNLKFSSNVDKPLIVKIRFSALADTQHKILITANQHKVFTFVPKKNETAPYDISFEIEPEMLVAGKLQLKFRNTYGVSTALQMGIAPLEITITEK
ncbi:MAG: LTA synthase family protein [Acetobacter sp.]|nr:LTA synthase family protein [Acetobacter sp.]